MTRHLMLAFAALALLMLVVSACLVVHVENFDLGRYRTCRVVTSRPVVELHGPYVRIVWLRLPSGPVILYRGPHDH